jgi:aspartate 1-decarboxylase
MLIPFLVSKIQDARITGLEPETSGGVAIDGELLKEAGIREYQKVEVCNLTRGTHFETCTAALDGNTGQVVLKGTAAHQASLGDKIIIAAYALLDELEFNSRNTTFLIMNEDNGIERIVNGKL